MEYFKRFLHARAHLFTHSLVNVIAHFTPILTPKCAFNLNAICYPSHGFYCDFTHFPIVSSDDPFHSLAHMSNKQGMVYGYCKKCLLECIGDGESRP